MLTAFYILIVAFVICIIATVIALITLNPVAKWVMIISGVIVQIANIFVQFNVLP